jgi:C4-dicarboxylate transporter
MNSVTIWHLASMIVGALAVAFIFSINLQGPRLLEPWWRGMVRRFAKIMGLLLYAMTVVQLLTIGAETRGMSRWLASGGAIVLMGIVLVWMLMPMPSHGTTGEGEADADAAAGRD